MTLIVAFGNKAQHGKDTAGESVVNFFERKQKNLIARYGSIHKPYTSKLYKFAGALYQECREQHGMTTKDPVLLQKVGAARRAENVNYWIEKLAEQIKKDNVDLAVITDVRHKNEAAWVKGNGGVLVNVSRLNKDGSPYVSLDRPATHLSEIDLDGYTWDYFIKAYTGQSAVVEQLAITIVEFEKAMRP